MAVDYSYQNIIQKKIHTLQSIVPQITLWKLESKKIVFTNGCFDILHRGHVQYLANAADSGNVLIVGINADSSVKKLNKGATRPIQDENSRAFIIASLHVVDAVIIFDDETPLQLIEQIMPDVLVKGGDWKVENIVGADLVLKNGGEVKSISFVDGYSTTAIEQKIISSVKK